MLRSMDTLPEKYAMPWPMLLTPSTAFDSSFSESNSRTADHCPVIQEVKQDTIIVKKNTLAGIRFIPIQHQLESVSRSFYGRPASVASEYLLAEIYLVLSCAPGLRGISWACKEHIYGMLLGQLNDGEFSETPEEWELKYVDHSVMRYLKMLYSNI
ncbi:hypothetical protein N7540_013217 [Penicillium herquei]|nr:hypothetical protein N7540_013217 [Penicillium herquei]